MKNMRQIPNGDKDKQLKKEVDKLRKITEEKKKEADQLLQKKKKVRPSGR